jgi:hypothetical protein
VRQILPTGLTCSIYYEIQLLVTLAHATLFQSEMLHFEIERGPLLGDEAGAMRIDDLSEDSRLRGPSSAPSAFPCQGELSEQQRGLSEHHGFRTQL